MRLKLFYRLSNQPAAQPKEKLPEASKEACLRNCIDVFGLDAITVYGDRLNEETTAMIAGTGVRCVTVDEGSGGGNFRRASADALTEPDDTLIYLVEDDFLHKRQSSQALREAINLGAHYVTLYDHPDKYINADAGGNPHVKEGGEQTRLLCGAVSHWKITGSTVMTFATTAAQYRKDWKIFLKHCQGRYTDDYRIFKSLAWRRRKLLSAVPGIATHVETKFLSPFTDWAQLATQALDRAPSISSNT